MITILADDACGQDVFLRKLWFCRIPMQRGNQNLQDSSRLAGRLALIRKRKNLLLQPSPQRSISIYANVYLYYGHFLQPDSPIICGIYLIYIGEWKIITGYIALHFLHLDSIIRTIAITFTNFFWSLIIFALYTILIYYLAIYALPVHTL